MVGVATVVGATYALAIARNGKEKTAKPPMVERQGRCRWNERARIEGRDLADLDTKRLSNGWEMPIVGFGTAGLGEHTQQAVEWALDEGYRHVDSAQARAWYREDLVGKALRERRGRVPREDVFLTSKLHPIHFGFNRTLAQFQQSLHDLNTAYLDLFLLHYPSCTQKLCGDELPQGTWKDAWRALELLHRRGVVRSLGVSNFQPHQVEELLRFAEVCPVVLQAYSDPLSNNVEIQELCAREGIQFVAYSSLGIQWILRGAKANPVLENPVIRGIAAERNCTVGGAVIAWAHRHGQVVIPRSSKRERIRANLHERCKLTDRDVVEIDALNKRGT